MDAAPAAILGPSLGSLMIALDPSIRHRNAARRHAGEDRTGHAADELSAR
jgi:hypothetical protein